MLICPVTAAVISAERRSFSNAIDSLIAPNNPSVFVVSLSR